MQNFNPITDMLEQSIQLSTLLKKFQKTDFVEYWKNPGSPRNRRVYSSIK